MKNMNRNFIKKISPLFGIFIAGAAVAQPGSNVCFNEDVDTILYVDASAQGSNDGSSWDNAFTSLESAAASASSIFGEKQIWVASGNYSASGDGIVLTSNTLLLGGFDGTESSLSERATEGNPTRVRNEDGRMFSIDSSVNVTIDSFVFSGGLKTDLASQEVNGADGGAVLALNSEVKVCNSKFVDNMASRFGGAIYAEGGEMLVYKSTFVKNLVLKGFDEVHDSLDEADTDGGAIAANDLEFFQVVDSKFLRNIAGDDGAAIAVRRSDVTIERSLFKENRGIALVLGASNPIFTNDFFTGMGAGVSIHNEYIGFNEGDQSHDVKIVDSRFVSNQSGIGSAAFILNAPGSNTLIEGSVFANNGGNGQPELNDGDASNGNETGVTYGRGAGAMLIVGNRAGDREVDSQGRFVRGLNRLTINNSKFIGNQSGYGGSIVMVAVDGTIKDTKFINNSARQRGGAIWNQNFFPLFDQLSGLTPEFGEVSIYSSLFKGNQALGILETLQPESFPGIATVEEQTFGGGAISNDTAGMLRVIETQFIGNKSINSDGGAIHNATTPVAFYLAQNAPGDYPSTLEVHNSVFKKNEATGNGLGGAIANGGNQVNGSVIDVNGEDRALTTEGSNAFLYYNIFTKNSTSNSGGAVSNVNGSTLELVSNIFAKNEAPEGSDISSIGIDVNRAQIISESTYLKGNSKDSRIKLVETNVEGLLH